MPTSFPGAVDSYTTKVDNVSDVLAADINNVQDAIVAIQNRIGANASGAVILAVPAQTISGAKTFTGNNTFSGANTFVGITSGSTTAAAFSAATTGGGFSTMWTRYAPFRATINHTGSSYAPGFSMYYEYTGGYLGHYSLGHLATSAANPGNFCIHHINSAGASLSLWQFDGANGNFISQGNVTAYSDERLKKDWAALPSDFIERLATVKSGLYTRIDTNERQAGASAQDWQKLLPEAVMTGADEDKTLSLAYGNAALVSAVELAKQAVRQEARIKALETMVEKLLEK
jgi:hypothetical protein